MENVKRMMIKFSFNSIGKIKSMKSFSLFMFSTKKEILVGEKNKKKRKTKRRGWVGDMIVTCE